ncbi:hypothetical protein DRF59_06640 [Chryseobacterium flavum]|uniref:Uncharacterized protein n=1 Tax=Chryseobacterium flavum TaxID=415851 RepID=A0A3D9CQF2_9FLAO|nr:hypothetical protein [Chryseobacterium flavum]REC67984.1 hypothetical protein DRF59_06640 [Chryseobacterium flavum]
MKDLFYYSFIGKRKDQVIRFFKKRYSHVLRVKDNWIRITINQWYKTQTISCLMRNGLVTMIIVRTVVFPFYEKYTAF